MQLALEILENLLKLFIAIKLSKSSNAKSGYYTGAL